ncbi:hypothetical protein K449DRAFT_137792 [Hypoxylon sp. EC38]|nr:hypothetical protein K449DRAFT_137792 [Hypoxylon sp. EC38]
MHVHTRHPYDAGIPNVVECVGCLLLESVQTCMRRIRIDVSEYLGNIFMQTLFLVTFLFWLLFTRFSSCHMQSNSRYVLPELSMLHDAKQEVVILRTTSLHVEARKFIVAAHGNFGEGE